MSGAIPDPSSAERKCSSLKVAIGHQSLEQGATQLNVELDDVTLQAGCYGQRKQIPG
jgi:hypothetical protein